MQPMQRQLDSAMKYLWQMNRVTGSRVRNWIVHPFTQIQVWSRLVTVFSQLLDEQGHMSLFPSKLAGDQRHILYGSMIRGTDMTVTLLGLHFGNSVMSPADAIWTDSTTPCVTYLDDAIRHLSHSFSSTAPILAQWTVQPLPPLSFHSSPSPPPPTIASWRRRRVSLIMPGTRLSN